MQKHTQFALALLAAAVLAGCSSTPLTEPAPVETRPAEQPKVVTPPPVKPAESKVQTVDFGAELLKAANEKGRTVYFDFDSFVVKDEYRGLIEAHAKRLGNDRKVALSLEGHADERGGREYNLALGQKRAEAVVQSLTLLGAQAGQVEPVSFGKERPAVQGHDEAAWAKNRRVELKDK
ncbi:peptidoglycan-associated lipoprotein Pal [Paucibacter sp. APW11]|uniref:Peptidoglycan-associated lipoprotein n=1 Tax=Roseateles aquae TaxID=3077235 RepID=A0ABU3P9L1_9BURK|nr:peptidoglycan-associated lipoprotein Pal [Paucibacter sp. APW11]MDT8999259.1 peptidoglycan-associated lipoprotein Pal [Paucibacter sp. APW11]